MRMRSSLLAALFVTAGLAGAANAGTITSYTDRSAWLADAAAAGLTVTVEDFEEEPTTFPLILVGPVTIDLGETRSVYDAGNERIGFTSGGGRVLSFDITASSVPLFGFGLDMGPTIGNVRTTDVDGEDIATGAGDSGQHFVGLLGTAPLDPANPFPSNPALSGASEFLTSGLALSVYIDDIVVANGVPEPGAAALLLVGAGLLAARTRQR